MTTALAVLPAIGLAFSLGCTSPAVSATAVDTTGATAATDAKSSQTDAKFVNNYSQGYGAHLVFHGGEADGFDLKLDRDLFEAAATGTIFSFGSSHMVQPAISLAIQDDQMPLLTHPKTGKQAKTQLRVQFQFGNLIEAVGFPVATPKAGDYPFSCKAPLLSIYFKNVTYKSTCPELAGHIVVTDWSSQNGGRFAGQFSGRLQGFFPDSQQDCADANAACSKSDVYVDVDGVFGFELPAPNGGAKP